MLPGYRQSKACRILFKVGCALLGLIALTVTILFFRQQQWRPIAQTLSNGTIARVEGLTYGSSHFFSHEPIKEKIRAWLPNRFKRWLGPTKGTLRTQTIPNSLVVWTTRADPGFGGLGNESHYLVDAHGCRFRSRRAATRRGQGDALSGVSFEAFPRTERTLNYVICDNSGNVLGEFKVPNLFQVAEPANWIPEKLPITKTNRQLAVELRRLRSLDAVDVHPIRPQISFVRAEDVELWDRPLISIYDRSGNRSSDRYCTNETVWKIQADFFRKARAEFSRDETWVITNVAIPKPDEVTVLRTTKTVQGCSISVQALEGPYYAGPAVFEVRRNPATTQVPSIPPDPTKLFIRSQHSPGDAKILVRARDNTGRKLVARMHSDSPEGNNPAVTYWNQRFDVQPFPDSTSLDIEVLVQKPTTFEFIVEGANDDYGPRTR